MIGRKDRARGGPWANLLKLQPVKEIIYMSTPEQPIRPQPPVQPPSFAPSGNPYTQETAPPVNAGPGSPGNPGNPGNPGGTPGGTPGNDDQPKKFSLAILLGIAGAVLVVAGIGGYLFGHNSGQSSGYTDGQQAGYTAGKAAGVAEYAKGTAGYNNIYLAGKSSGKAIGTAKGKKEGVKYGKQVGFEQGDAAGKAVGKSEGEKAGATTGANLALGGFTEWVSGTNYIVTAAPGPSSEVPYVISTRSVMKVNTEYALCQSNPAKICQKPETVK